LLAESFFENDKAHPSGLPDWILSDRPGNKKENSFVDEFMGSMW
jgi:hypothetical protein